MNSTLLYTPVDSLTMCLYCVLKYSSTIKGCALVVRQLGGATNVTLMTVLPLSTSCYTSVSPGNYTAAVFDWEADDVIGRGPFWIKGFQLALTIPVPTSTPNGIGSCCQIISTYMYGFLCSMSPLSLSLALSSLPSPSPLFLSPLPLLSPSPPLTLPSPSPSSLSPSPPLTCPPPPLSVPLCIAGNVQYTSSNTEGMIAIIAGTLDVMYKLARWGEEVQGEGGGVRGLLHGLFLLPPV